MAILNNFDQFYTNPLTAKNSLVFFYRFLIFLSLKKR